MKQGVAKVKERYNWPVTILLIIGIVLIILLPLYMARTGTAQKAASAELRRCLGDDRFPPEIF